VRNSTLSTESSFHETSQSGQSGDHDSITDALWLTNGSGENGEKNIEEDWNQKL